MSSIIEGYNYDIFISYRQKDNKGDRWVSEFVDSLKTELESTFKEDISIYFDENPHDGLLETHSVDKSLEGKLKCLIFIPVISQTYCDSKSYAWQHEFCTFNKLAKEDRFRRDIRLANGNVASRILPVMIHDLDTEDKTLLENELEGVLRAIEFIYKSAGVNRPLRANEDHPQDNLNKTYYRDQINKVANAIKEIITSIKKHNQQEADVTEKSLAARIEKHKIPKTKIILSSVIVIAFIALGYVFIPKLFKSSEQIEKSIAVLPFANLSKDPEQEYFSDGMVDAILDNLFKIGELKVISRTSSMRYKNSKLPLKEIARELGVSAILEGSVQKIDNNVRITVQLINTKTDAHLWSDTYDRTLSDIFSIQSEVAQNVARELKTTLTREEKKLIEKIPTNSTEAYNLYLQGRFFWNKRSEEGLKKSIEYFKKSISVDPDYALAYAGLADAYHIQTWWQWAPRSEGFAMAKEFALKALELDENLAEAHATLGALLFWNEWNWEEANKELNLAIRLNPKYGTAHQYYSEYFDILRQNDDARKQIDIALDLDPLSSVMHFLSARYYYHEGKFEKSIDEFSKTLELNPDYNAVYGSYFFIYTRLGEDMKAIEALQKYILNDSSALGDPEAVREVYGKSGMKGVLNWCIIRQKDPLVMARWYALLENKEETLASLEKALEEHAPEIPTINNNPLFENLRSEPRFKAIIKKMGLADFQVVN